MSDEESQVVQTEDGQMLTAEYKDGQLQIVEVTPFDKSTESHLLPDTNADDGDTKYLQVLDPSKGLMHLDLLNFTLVKCLDGDNSYQVVGTGGADDGDTLTCVLSSEDPEDNENQDSYVMVKSEGGDEPVVYLQSTLQQIHTQQNLRKTKEEPKKKNLTPTEILEKAKALQKAKALLQSEHSSHSSNRGRKRKSDLPPPMELLASPNFKLYLYSCKLCSFKCNAVKDMSKHKASEHGAGKGRGSGGRSAGATLQCAQCPFRGTVHSQLINHIRDMHYMEGEDEEDEGTEITLEGCDIDGAVSEADVLVCGACGFESAQRDEFREHIAATHGVNVMLKASMLSIDDESQSN